VEGKKTDKGGQRKLPRKSLGCRVNRKQKGSGKKDKGVSQRDKDSAEWRRVGKSKRKE